MKDYVTCAICENRFRRVTRTHLLKHNITTSQYQEQYPTSPLICESLLNETSTYFREKNPMKDPKTVAKFSKATKGVRKTEEHKRNLSESQKGERSHMWGKKRPEHSAFMKNLIQKKKAEGSYTPPVQVPWTEDRRAKMRAARLGKPVKRNPNKASRKGIKLKLTDAQRAERSYKSAMAVKLGKIPKFDTSIEIDFKNYCHSKNIKFDAQFLLSNKNITWVYDFFLPDLNMLVEIDGEFWHRTAKQINRDKLKTNSAIEAGFRFVRISSEDLRFDLIFQDNITLAAHNSNLLEQRERRLKS